MSFRSQIALALVGAIATLRDLRSRRQRGLRPAPFLRSAHKLHLLAARRDRTWPRFVKTFLSTLAVGVVALVVFVVIVDPYDTGRFGTGWLPGNVEDDVHTEAVSLGRDQRFDSAVIGNSHGLMLDPQRLSAANGDRFVQLTAQGTSPREQMAILRWFLRHHRHVGAILLVADPLWCTLFSDPAPQFAFPLWLYSDSDVDYLLHVLSKQAAGRAWRRILVAVGLRRPDRIPAYRDYEIGREWRFRPTLPESLNVADLSPRQPARPFPAAERFDALLSELAPGVPVIIVFSPVFVTELPTAGSAQADRLAECKGALARLAARRGSFLDFAVDGEIARDPRNFMDSNHYRGNVARLIEQGVVGALAQTREAMPGR
jgi:hypothetical protein